WRHGWSATPSSIATSKAPARMRHRSCVHISARSRFRHCSESEVTMPEQKMTKTDGEWQQQLTPEQYQVTRKKGTERAFTGEYWDTKKPGTYTCVCCGQPLFDASTKFDSGTGWPSFWQPLKPESVTKKEDRGWFSVRTEVLCSRCDAHLGHV